MQIEIAFYGQWGLVHLNVAVIATVGLYTAIVEMKTLRNRGGLLKDLGDVRKLSFSVIVLNSKFGQTA